MSVLSLYLVYKLKIYYDFLILTRNKVWNTGRNKVQMKYPLWENPHLWGGFLFEASILLIHPVPVSAHARRN